MTKYRNDPSEEYETEVTNEELFWDNISNQTKESVAYVQELMIRIRAAENQLLMIQDKINLIIRKLNE